MVAEDYGEDQWKALSEQADLKYGHAGGLDKNALHIAEMLGSALNQHGQSPTLERLCISLISCAGSVNEPTPESEAAKAAVAALLAI